MPSQRRPEDDLQRRVGARAWSVSSMRSRNVPPSARAAAQLYIAVRAPPRCSGPVGDGAKRRRGFDGGTESADMGKSWGSPPL
jgi:hypothetical protein